MNNQVSHTAPSALGNRGLLIHIGFFKALSSWMQKKLFKPRCGFLPVMNQFAVQIALIDPPPFTFSPESAYKFIQEQLDKKDPEGKLYHVISAEGLSGNPYCGGFNGKQNVDRIKQTFPDAKVLFVTREQRSLIRSLYKTQVLWGIPYSIEDLLQPKHTSIAPQFNLDFLRFDQRIAYYQSLFGEENVLVLPFELFIHNPQQFIEQVANFCPLTETEKQTALSLNFAQKVNTNAPLVQIEWQRLLNRFIYRSPFNQNAPFEVSDEQMLDRLARHKKDIFPAFTRDWLEQGFQEKVMELTLGEFAESNRKLSELTGIDLKSLGYEID